MAADYESHRWCTVDETDPISGENNKINPPPEIKSSGLKRYEPFTRQWLNWMFNRIYLSVKNLQEQINNLTQSDTDNQALLQLIYGVGDVWYTTTEDNPADRFGFGTWEKIDGRFIVASSSTDSNFNVAGKTGGSKTHSHSDNFSVNSHTLTESQVPNYVHSHEYRDRYYAQKPSVLGGATYTETMPLNYNGNEGSGSNDEDNTIFLYFTATTESSSFGGGGSHKHGLSGGVSSATTLPPYYVQHVWKRIA